MKIAHWTFLNGSGLTNMALDMVNAEVALGIESYLCNTNDIATWKGEQDVDIHVVHSHIPDNIAFNKKNKLVVVQHGAPEHIFETSVNQGLTGNYGASDPLAMIGYLLKRANAVVTFWPRQEEILRTMSSVPIFCIPMGIDTAFWRPVPKQNLLTGQPSILTCENSHTCKWPIDAMFMWPWVVEKFSLARMHFLNVPYDQHRWWLPLSYMTGARYTTYISPQRLNPVQLRDFICAADYYYSPVEYGDFNRMSLEARACGCKIISYRGNTYADYWITEGDQRVQAFEMVEILSGNRPVVEPDIVPDISETAKAMRDIYRGLL